MREIAVKDLIDLVVSEVPDVELKIQKMFDWHFERVKITSQWLLGASASLFISVLIAFSRNEVEIDLLQIAGILLGGVSVGAYGLYLIMRLRSLQTQFVAALKLHAEFKRIRPFILLYRDEFK